MADAATSQRNALPAQTVPVGPPAYLVAAGGVLVVLELPVVGLLSRLVGIAMVLVGVLQLAGLATEPGAQRRLRAAAATAVLVALLQVVVTLAALLVLDDTDTVAAAAPAASTPGWTDWASLAHMALGVAGTLLLAAGMARELHQRGQAEAEDAWWHVAIAVVVIQAPIVVAAVPTQVVGRPAGVHGTAALLLFAAAIVPYGLLARAGRHSS
jgi:hypothetical protein